MPVAQARPSLGGKLSLPSSENPANCGVFAFWLWTSVPHPSPLFGEKIAKFSLSGAVDFLIVKSTGWFSEFLTAQELRVVSGERFYGVNACPAGCERVRREKPDRD
jgi:hypothetical protein